MLIPVKRGARPQLSPCRVRVTLSVQVQVSEIYLFQLHGSTGPSVYQV
jgi:hypothetical protein